MSQPGALRYTKYREFEQFQAEEIGIDIKGYIHSVDGMRSVKSSQGHVFKFVISNGGKHKIRVVIWGTKEGRKWESQIKPGLEIEICGGKLQLIKELYRDPNIYKMELIVLTATDIIIHGTRPSADLAQYPIIKFDELSGHSGPAEIHGWIRSRIRIVQTNYSKFGQCTVADGSYRLTVNIAGLEIINDQMTVGTPVTIKGEMDFKNIIFRVSSENFIIRPNVPVMNLDDLENSTAPITHAPPRKRQVITTDSADLTGSTSKSTADEGDSSGPVNGTNGSTDQVHKAGGASGLDDKPNDSTGKVDKAGGTSGSTDQVHKAGGASGSGDKPNDSTGKVDKAGGTSGSVDKINGSAEPTNGSK